MGLQGFKPEIAVAYWYVAKNGQFQQLSLPMVA